MMPRGNLQNLIQNTTELTPAQRRENARKAGIASGKARGERRDTRQKLTYALAHPALPELIKEIKDRGYSLPDQPDIEDLAVIQTVLDYAKGNAKARRDIWEAQGIIKNKISLDGEVTVKTVRFE